MLPLEITTVETTSIRKAHGEARRILASVGVSEHALDVAFQLLSGNQNLRGPSSSIVKLAYSLTSRA